MSNYRCMPYYYPNSQEMNNIEGFFQGTGIFWCILCIVILVLLVR